MKSLIAQDVTWNVMVVQHYADTKSQTKLYFTDQDANKNQFELPADFS